MSEYQQFLQKLQEKFNEFVEEAKNAETTKAAGQRARKKGQELRNDFKEFRNISLNQDKNIKK